MLKLISHLAIATLIFSFSQSLFAASVTQVKGNRVMIDLEGDVVVNGSQVYLLNSSGKRAALVKISSVKGSRALGTVTKGKAQIGFTVQLAGQTATKSSGGSTVVRTDGGAKGKLSFGGLVGFGMQTMTLKVQTGGVSEDATLKGNAISFKGFADYKFSDSFTIRVASGLEPFKTTGSINNNLCNSGKNCEVSFNYITFEGGVQYNIMNGPTRVWLGLGYAFLLEMSKSINVPNLNASGSNQMLLVGGGADIGVGSAGSYIPLVVEYGMFPGSSNVTASSIFLRTGYGMSF